MQHAEFLILIDKPATKYIHSDAKREYLNRLKYVTTYILS